ncbi:AAA family ATPase [Pseudomonadota bacterium]
MYEKFYGLTKEPFRLSPDSEFCYRHQSYKKAKAYMQYALHRGEGFVMITGRPGTGKTTLINDLKSEFTDEEVVFATIVCTQLQADDLLRLVVLNFGLDANTEHKSTLIHQLEQYLKRLHYEGKRPLLVIDEAQDLETSALEELRLLTNLQQSNKPLLQIFLVGQEALREMVLIPQLEQLHQRIVAACHLQPLKEASTEEYIKHRLQQTGWKGTPELNPYIFPLIFKFSLGIPRWINLICSRLLLHGMVEERTSLGIGDILSVLDGLIQEQLLPTDLESELDYLRTELEENSHRNKPVQETAVNSIAEGSAYSPASSIKSNQSEETNSDFNTDETSNNLSTEIISHTDQNKAPGQKHMLKATHTHPSNQIAHLNPIEEAKKLYSQLAPLLFGKAREKRMEIFLQFVDGKSINGTVISVPYENLASNGPARFMVWLESSRNTLSKETREVLWLLLDLVDQ